MQKSEKGIYYFPLLLFHYFLSLSFWDRASHQTWSFPFWLGCLAIELPGNTYLCSPNSGVIDTCIHTWLLCGCLGFELMSSCFHSSSSYPLSYIPQLLNKGFESWGNLPVFWFLWKKLSILFGIDFSVTVKRKRGGSSNFDKLLHIWRAERKDGSISWKSKNIS